jgi:hypothetical protein
MKAQLTNLKASHGEPAPALSDRADSERLGCELLEEPL